MPEIKKTIKIFGHDVPVTEIPSKSALEFFNEYELEDGSKVKVKFVATSFLRVDGEYSHDDKPVYLVFSSPAVNVMSAPPVLLRPPKTKPN